MRHGVYLCGKCGRKIGGCTCPEHQEEVLRRLPNCVTCTPTRETLKDQLGINEKDR